jgi:transcription-repair coupling factor (superfamily II helicase)
VSDLDLDPRRPQRLTLGGAPAGHDARVVAELARTRAGAGGGGLLHIALDDAAAARFQQVLGFFAPEVEVVAFPAWDCLPYDRVSPNPDVVSRRTNALSRLASGRPADRPWIVLATVNAALQRVPAPEAFRNTGFAAKVGDRLDVDEMQRFLERNGYSRAQTVREPGEYAVRGGIVDLFPPGTEEPFRLDLFGDEIEGIRRFDALSQRTTDTADRVVLEPMSEVLLDSESIARFRKGYRELFGAVTGDDPLYEAVSEGRKFPGMEHWLPLFHERMATLFDYLPEAPVVLEHQADQARETRLGQIAEFHEARQTMQAVDRKAKAPVYRPLPPERLYLTAEEWQAALDARAVAQLSPFAAPDGVGGAVDAGGRRGRDFADVRNDPEANVFDAVRRHVVDLTGQGRRVVIAGYTPGARERLGHLLAEHGLTRVTSVDDGPGVDALDPGRVGAAVLTLETGFVAPDLAVMTEQDILGDRLTRPQRKRRRGEEFLTEAASLTAGDLVVHVDHGIGRYEGLETLTVGGAPHDCLKVVYAGEDKLFVPVENIEVLSRYGSEETPATLDRLGGAAWQARKARVKKRLKDMADELMKIAAARMVRDGAVLPPPEGAYEEFAARFPYPETEDQLKAIEEVLDDLVAGKPMDRLVCGDVGFGKTEVALRAAFVTAMQGKQVAVVVPTTLLARQHYKTFLDRFQNLPIRIGRLSRLVGQKETKAVKDGIKDGGIDIVVGTHALLADSVKFRDLGLVIVDEEQHFGVKQKEKLKRLRADVHVLTLTATPIPRTLQLALSGVRELSLIATPPVDRLAVRTFVLPFDPVVMREAILREHFRGGQTYYVCPRIEDLGEVEEMLKALVPEVKIVTAHGRMTPSRIEEVMTAFYDGQFDVLLCTTIVESGLDVPSANTMIMHRADMLGLAQMYQLRGRIGRSKLRGYAYLTYAADKPLNATAQQRLHVIETLDSLGAGFSLASHDMDIRGAGNLLGEEQSGQVREVGIELYQQLLEEAVAAAKGDQLETVEAESWTPQINLGMPVLIPESYVADLSIRLELYRRIGRLVDRQEIDAFAAELIDRFGPLPDEVENLLELVSLKRLCKQAGIEKLEAGPKGAVVQFHNNSFARPDKLVDYISRQAGTIKMKPDHKLVYLRAWENPKQRMKGAGGLVQNLAELAA